IPGGSDRARLRRFCAAGAFRRRMIVPHGQALSLLHIQCRVSRCPSAVVISVLLAIDGRDVRRIPVEIGTSDSELLAVLIDPFPEGFGGNPSLGACSAFDTHDVGRQPVAIAAAEAPAMV